MGACTEFLRMEFILYIHFAEWNGRCCMCTKFVCIICLMNTLECNSMYAHMLGVGVSTLTSAPFCSVHIMHHFQVCTRGNDNSELHFVHVH